ncbi:MAG: hypothetical protein OEQ53_04780 [Saprospiraceae bacterium]|nr:hypothetical protein [Saprospiraceae bacterium]
MQQMQSMLPNSHRDFFASLALPSPVSIRSNPFKPIPLDAGFDQVPWCPSASYLPERPVFTLDPLFHAGCYYVQEPSSMLVDLALKEIGIDTRPITALDLCAAPGGKSTLLASALHPDSLILCNEVNRRRSNILRHNLEKWGQTNMFTSQQDPSSFTSLSRFFDLILVDAPCSGEGLFRKNSEAARHWSEAAVNFCSSRQRRILENVIPSLRPGGTLIYSTCTYNDQENIAMADYLSTIGLESVELRSAESYGFVKKERKTAVGYQAFPHLVKGEGLFLAAFSNTRDERLPAAPRYKNMPAKGPIPQEIIQYLGPQVTKDLLINHKKEIYYVSEAHRESLFQVRSFFNVAPITLGEMKRAFRPSHGLALSTLIDYPDVMPLKLDQARQFLSKKPIDNLSMTKGWHLPTYHGYGLGWIKSLGYRYNNYLPSELRILRDIDLLKGN